MRSIPDRGSLTTGGEHAFRNGAAQESNLPSVGLRRRTGFEDQLGHQPRPLRRGAYRRFYKCLGYACTVRLTQRMKRVTRAMPHASRRAAQRNSSASNATIAGTRSGGRKPKRRKISTETPTRTTSPAKGSALTASDRCRCRERRASARASAVFVFEFAFVMSVLECTG